MFLVTLLGLLFTVASNSKYIFKIFKNLVDWLNLGGVGVKKEIMSPFQHRGALKKLES